MPIKYYKLFDVLQRREMKKTDLLKFGITSPTLAKISKGANINTESIERICKALKVQPANIMEYVDDDLKDDDGFYNPANVQWIKESIEQLKQGKVVIKTIEELEEMAK